MKLEKINKSWITANDMSEALGISVKLSKILLENSTIFWTMKKRYQYVDENGRTIITKIKPCKHVAETYDVVYGDDKYDKIFVD